jgi:hypothetical protein
MLEQRWTGPPDGRTADGAQDMLLAGLEDALLMDAPLTEYRPLTRTRRCPCCARPIRAGQPVTTIHGTRVHVGCARPCASGPRGI